ncbi:MAG: hypothetical protein MJ072_00445, partial [Clostridia bacterium]|nr:hypothetical protein [Clostridia bacterium]
MGKFYGQEFTSGQNELYFIGVGGVDYKGVNYLVASYGDDVETHIEGATNYECYFVKGVEIFNISGTGEVEYVARLEYDLLHSTLNANGIRENVKYVDGNFEFATDKTGFTRQTGYNYYINPRDAEKGAGDIKRFGLKETNFDVLGNYGVILNISANIKILDGAFSAFDVYGYQQKTIYFEVLQQAGRTLKDTYEALKELISSNTFWYSFKDSGGVTKTEKTNMQILSAYIAPASAVQPLILSGLTHEYHIGFDTLGTLERVTKQWFVRELKNGSFFRTFNLSNFYNTVNGFLDITQSSTPAKNIKMSIGTFSHRLNILPKTQTFNLRFDVSQGTTLISLETESGVMDITRDLTIIPPASDQNGNNVQQNIATATGGITSALAIAGGIATGNPLVLAGATVSATTSLLSAVLEKKSVSSVVSSSDGY